MISELPESRITYVLLFAVHIYQAYLEWQWTCRQGRTGKSTTTSANYRLYAPPGNPPQRPGLIRVDHHEQGVAIKVEVWELP